jgi:hypothetical protein
MKLAHNWRSQLNKDTIPALVTSSNQAIVYFAGRDLLDEQVKSIVYVWGLPEPQKLILRQQTEGSWRKTADKSDTYPPHHHRLVETFKRFRVLVERYDFNNNHPSIKKAAEFLFSCQAEEGDIRGFIGNQYATYYTGYILSLLIRAGYESDPRVEKGLQWLLSMRQNDGGWTVPILTHRFDRETWYRLTSQYMDPVPPDKTRPFSHNWTDMVLRAFAVHSRYRKSDEARVAGGLLKSSFFEPDAYTSYQSPRYWTRFAFWWPNLLTTLESLALLGFTADDPDIKRGLDWFIENQQEDGLWKLESNKDINPRDTEERLWLGLAVCRMLKRYYP